MKFHEFMQRDAMAVPLAASDRDEAIRELVASLGRSGAISLDAVEEIVSCLLERERNGTTGFGRGVAVPHCKTSRVGRLVGTVGLSVDGIDFNALDRRPVHAIFVLLSPAGQDATHLDAMASVFRNVGQDAFRRSLRQAATPAAVAALLDEADAQQPRPTPTSGLAARGV